MHCFSISIHAIFTLPLTARSLAGNGKKPPQNTAATAAVKSRGIVQDSAHVAGIKPCSVPLTLDGWNSTKGLEITRVTYWS